VSTLFQNDAKLIQTTLDALADEPVVVVATTASVDPSQFRVPVNAHVERFVPHSVVLQRAACVVCHGGSGITGKALMEGVPVCVVPFARDQFEIARRIEVAGAGARLPASRLRPGRLRRAVEQARGCRDGAVRARELLRAAGGAEAAADALEGLPAGRRGATDPTSVTG
jgi:MGT family glycosyltransferase